MSLLKKIVGQFIEREPRIEINPLHHVELNLVGKNKPFSLYNLSSSGLAFMLESPAEPEEYPSGKNTNARLQLEDKTIHLSLQYVHQTPRTIGCRISNIQNDIRDTIYNYFEYEVMAQKVKYFAPKDLKKEVDGEPHWFSGDNNCSLYYVAQKERVVRFFISYFGNIIEMNSNSRLTWGLVYDGTDMDQRSGHYFPHDDAVLTRNFSEQSMLIFKPVLRFIGGLQQINPVHKKYICDKLEDQFQEPKQG